MTMSLEGQNGMPSSPMEQATPKAKEGGSSTLGEDTSLMTPYDVLLAPEALVENAGDMTTLEDEKDEEQSERVQHLHDGDLENGKLNVEGDSTDAKEGGVLGSVLTRPISGTKTLVGYFASTDHVGNNRFRIFLDLHRAKFANAVESQDWEGCDKVASLIVDTICHKCTPSGRFLIQKQSEHVGVEWLDLGDGLDARRVVAWLLRARVSDGAIALNAPSPPPRPSSVPTNMGGTPAVAASPAGNNRGTRRRRSSTPALTKAQAQGQAPTLPQAPSHPADSKPRRFSVKRLFSRSGRSRASATENNCDVEYAVGSPGGLDMVAAAAAAAAEFADDDDQDGAHNQAMTEGNKNRDAAADTSEGMKTDDEKKRRRRSSLLRRSAAEISNYFKLNKISRRGSVQLPANRTDSISKQDIICQPRPQLASEAKKKSSNDDEDGNNNTDEDENSAKYIIAAHVDHVGNNKLKVDIDLYRTRYEAVGDDDDEQRLIIWEIMNNVKAWSGRFMREDTDAGGKWRELSRNEAVLAIQASFFDIVGTSIATNSSSAVSASASASGMSSVSQLASIPASPVPDTPPQPPALPTKLMNDGMTPTLPLSPHSPGTALSPGGSPVPTAAAAAGNVAGLREAATDYLHRRKQKKAVTSQLGRSKIDEIQRFFRNKGMSGARPTGLQRPVNKKLVRNSTN